MDEAQGKRVLVCDDERHIVRLLQVNLQRQGYGVTCAYGGREAIERLEREEFDIAVIDREMPDVDGPMVLAWIRAHERTKDMRVIMLDKERSDDGPHDPPGADLYLTKPFNPANIFSRA